MSVVLLVAAAMLGVAALLLVVRMTVGPTILDRSMALDVLMSVMVCAVALRSVHRDETWALPMLLALASVGFVGSVTVARFASSSRDLGVEDDDQDDGTDRKQRGEQDGEQEGATS